jgi:hypothetical protein
MAHVNDEKILVYFEKNLNELREIRPIRIVSMQSGRQKNLLIGTFISVK